MHWEATNSWAEGCNTTRAGIGYLQLGTLQIQSTVGVPQSWQVQGEVKLGVDSL